jgi:hypothetical protein
MNRNTSNEKQPKQPPPPPSTRGKKEAPRTPATTPGSGVEGEGSYTATRRYNEGLREHIEHHDVESEAEAARQAVEGDERAELEAAEEQGKRGPARPVQQTESGLGGPQPQHGKP